MHNLSASDDCTNLQQKPVVVQLPVYLYEKEFYVLETEIVLPAFYVPQCGSFFAHPVLPEIGRLNIDWWGYDGRDHKTYIALGVGFHDPTRCIDEFLRDYPQWSLAEDALLKVKERSADESGEEGFPWNN